jgi:hypothetical protein
MIEKKDVDFQSIKEEAVFKTKQGKLYMKGLQLAVNAGAISSEILKKKLSIDYKSACQMLNWMIERGFVIDDSCKDCLKTTLMSNDEFEKLRQILGYSLKTKREKQRTVDDALYKSSLRLAIKRKTINQNMLKDLFAIGSVKAKAVIDRMQEDGYLGEFDECLRRKILITKEKFKELYGEEI